MVVHEKPLIGLVPITKFVFSREDALRYKQKIEKKLDSLGITYINIDAVTPDGTLNSHDELPAVISHLRKSGVDALFCPHCNFGTEDVAALLGRDMGLPYLLWGPRDEHPVEDGTRLRDTQCGLFATSRILGRLDVPFTYIPNCRVEDPILERGLRAFVQVTASVKKMRNLRIGQIGQRNDFFWTVMVNEGELLEKFGIMLWQVDMTEILRRVGELVEKPDDRLRELFDRVNREVTFEGLGERQVMAVGALKLVLGDVAHERELDAIAFQCFPAMQETFDVYPCLANSLLTVEGLPVICEADIHGAVTACLLQSATLYEGQPFFADLTNRHPENDNAELLWHCGSFPLSLADEAISPKVGRHFIMPGGQCGVCHWKIKDGPLTIARFDADKGDYRLAFGQGETTTGPQMVGTYAWMQVRDWLAWEQAFIRGPYIHHVAAIHGSLAPVLHEVCRYLPALTSDPVDCTAKELEDYWWR